MSADLFTWQEKYERLIAERDAIAKTTEQIAQDYEDTIHPIELMDPEEFRQGQRKVSA